MTFSLEAEARPRRLKTEAFEISTEARPSRGTTAPRDGLETEASRPRPHPCSVANLLLGVIKRLGKLVSI